ncbi:hypothetical protein [Caldisericum sp.]|uniref:hypothetical protein n=1 Tax=Caldisericum sp. TaxID=2499687 RepID=UPI003D10BAEF
MQIVMEGRNFVIALNLDRSNIDKVEEKLNDFFVSNGYKPIGYADKGLIFQKGNRIFTYAGLTNWNYVFRIVNVDIVNEKREILLTYYFSWWTNIGILVRAAIPEVKELQIYLGANSLKVIKFR